MEPLTIPPQHTDKSRRDITPPSIEKTARDESFVVEIFKFAVLALIIVVPFRLFVAQPFIVNGASMSPTFETGQYLIVDQISYRLEAPERGDVVIFRYPNDPSKYFIKRIIGLPGEILAIKDGVTTITNPATNESVQINEKEYVVTPTLDDQLTIQLSSDEFFVMGDNRIASSDSRVWGPVPRRNIVGKAFVRLLPPTLAEFYPGEHHILMDPAREVPLTL